LPNELLTIITLPQEALNKASGSKRPETDEEDLKQLLTV